jgi:hypothetical protein
MEKYDKTEVTAEDIKQEFSRDEFDKKDPEGEPVNRKERRDKKYGRGRWKRWKRLR